MPRKPNALQERLLGRNWDLSIKEILVFYADFNEFDYAILLYCYENKLDNPKHHFKKTNLMWELNLIPSFYLRLMASVDKLVKKGFLNEDRLNNKHCKKPRIIYWLADSGLEFCNSLTKCKKN